MYPYWLFFALFAVGALLSRPDFRRTKPVSVSLLFGALVIVIFVGLRYRTGVDWGNYYRQWVGADVLNLRELITVHNGDAGFYGLMWALNGAGLGYWSLNLICAAIFTWGLIAFVKGLPNPWLGVAIATPYLIIVIAMSATRQASALGFIFLALVAFSERRTRAFLGWTAAGTLFHASAVLTLPFAGLSFARNKFQAILLAAAIALLAWLTLGSPFAVYSNRYVREAIQSTGLIYRVAMSAIAALLYFLIIQKRVALPDHERSLWRNYSLFALAAVAAATVFPTSTAIDRVLIYLFPLQIFVLGMVPYVTLRATAPVLVITLILLYSAAILFVFLNYAVNAPSYIPYQIYWISQR